MIQYIKATPEDAKMLSETAKQSKQIWGYSSELMKKWEEELTVTEKHIEKNKVFKVYQNNIYIGFFSLVKFINWTEIGHFWILPDYLRKGFGSVIFSKIIEIVTGYNEAILEVYAEPNANGFYEKMGGEIHKQIGAKEKGRQMNVYRIQLK